MIFESYHAACEAIGIKFITLPTNGIYYLAWNADLKGLPWGIMYVVVVHSELKKAFRGQFRLQL